MLDNIIGGLFVGWFLSLFGFDSMVIQCVKELFNITISTGTYYVGFAVIGVIGGFISWSIKIY